MNSVTHSLDHSDVTKSAAISVPLSSARDAAVQTTHATPCIACLDSQDATHYFNRSARSFLPSRCLAARDELLQQLRLGTPTGHPHQCTGFDHFKTIADDEVL